jgi:isocitrate dehydrogenase
LYAGVEYPVHSEEAGKIIDMAGGKIRRDAAISIKPISITGSRRIVKHAFDYAVENGRKKVTAVAKANIMKFTDGLFYEVAREWRRSTRAGSSTTSGSWTRCACSLSRSPKTTTCSSWKTCTATF